MASDIHFEERPMDYDQYTGRGRPDDRRDDSGRERATDGDIPPREEHRVPGEKLLDTVKKIVREGNVRRITIRNEDGKTLLEIPLTIGLAGAWLAPTFAAVGAVAALVTNCSIVVERAPDEE
jgi:hypothetical protein